MVMSRKRRNLLSKKRKNGKRNTKRNTKTRKNIMTGGFGKNVSTVKCDNYSESLIAADSINTLKVGDLIKEVYKKNEGGKQVEAIKVRKITYIGKIASSSSPDVIQVTLRLQELVKTDDKCEYKDVFIDNEYVGTTSELTSLTNSSHMLLTPK